MKKSKSQLVEETIKRFYGEIRTIARKYFISDGNFDDLLQEGLIGVVQAVDNYDFSRGDENSESFKKFVLMCVKRQILDSVKHSKRKKFSPMENYVSFDSSVDFLSENNEFSHKSSDPEEIVLEREAAEEKNKMIEVLLSEFEKLVLDLYLDGNSQSKIAEILKRDTKSIDNTLQRIKNKLRRK